MKNKMKFKKTIDICKKIRKDILAIAHASSSSHLGPALSSVEILGALYSGILKNDKKNHFLPDRDRFILSKGHGVMALYAALAQAGFLSKKELFSYCKNGSYLAEHPLAGKIPCIEFATGSLGHGLSLGVGLSLASRIKKIPYNTYVLMGDGECNEGSVWEAAGLASSLKLSNLIVLVDYNGLQATAPCSKLSGGYNLKDVWCSFGWSVFEVDGHDFNKIKNMFNKKFFSSKKPKVILARTIKGKGVSFMENSLEWHYRPLNAETFQQAITEQCI